MGSPGAAQVGTTLDAFERWYVAHESGNVGGLADALAEDVSVHSLFRPDSVAGREAAVAHFSRTTSTFTELAMALVSSPAVTGDTVLAEVMFTGAFTGELTWGGRLHRGTGRRFAVPGVLAVHIRSGQVTSVRTLFDRDDWLRQAGVLTA
ncbi:nuclear transport factor 2 family protein [Streptomyces malaysiensis]|uniref:Isopropylmalate/homocitrate/citramalate synthase n=1 Tax=Streptomyces malaysiensis TaxID=92644 RepID=A0A7X5XBJ6_STRMQ|nr:nuclear transport factor 2 family protein [Streptomyces malaysiensis]NIY69430.1 isopropylmalate/homocitrate/citramalate synthase [Streptomyces malaysiensis]